MPDRVKEKLVELIDDYTDPLTVRDIHKEDFAEKFADHLIANGVTVQQWIPVTERLPAEDGEYIVLIRGATSATTLYYYTHSDDWHDFESNYYNVTHWMPLPQPLKGD